MITDCHELVLPKTTEIYSFTVLESSSPKSVSLGGNQGVSRALLRPPHQPRRQSIPWLLQLPVAVDIPWLVAASGQSPPPMVTLPSPLLSLCNFPLPLCDKGICDGI